MTSLIKILICAVSMLVTANSFALPVIVTQPRNQTNVAGSTARFSVEATGIPPVMYQWRAYTTPTSFAELSGETNATLVLSNVQPTNLRYCAVVTDPEGSVLSSLVRLIVLIPPSIILQPADRSEGLGFEVRLLVLTSGTGPLFYQWQLDDLKLAGKTNAILTFASVQLSNSGLYSVVVTNGAGSVTSRVARLSVVGEGTYLTLAPPFDPALAIRRDSNQLNLSWTGRGQLQWAARPTGPWQSLAVASSPHTIQPQLAMAVYRIKHPRPATVYVPSSYDPSKPLPLIMLLHGYTGSGVEEDGYTRIRPLAEARGFLYCYPDGTTNNLGLRFWNATDACCDFQGAQVDDAGYLRDLIEEIGSQFALDRKRIYLVGESNGGFMAYRMACQHADIIAGIASLAGMTFLDPNRCAPSGPVNVLHIHGTADDTVAYGGGVPPSDIPGLPPNPAPFPGALQTIQFWAAYNGCQDPVTEAQPSLNLDLDVPGLDSVVTRYTNCPPGGATELWTINGGNHSPTLFNDGFSSEYSERVIDWLLAHPKP